MPTRFEFLFLLGDDMYRWLAAACVAAGWWVSVSAMAGDASLACQAGQKIDEEGFVSGANGVGVSHPRFLGRSN
jgi:hypothetical protein